MSTRRSTNAREPKDRSILFPVIVAVLLYVGLMWGLIAHDGLGLAIVITIVLVVFALLVLLLGGKKPKEPKH